MRAGSCSMHAWPRERETMHILLQVRKLEFLMADAKDRGHDSVITIGGIQSNHCRATAVAARSA